MAPLAARRLAEQTALGHRIVAIELLCAAQALDLRTPERLGGLTGQAFARVRELVSFAGSAAPYPSDLEPLVALVRSGAIGAAGPAA
jgi:histidine ammonia-lyase